MAVAWSPNYIAFDAWLAFNTAIFFLLSNHVNCMIIRTIWNLQWGGHIFDLGFAVGGYMNDKMSRWAKSEACDRCKDLIA